MCGRFSLFNLALTPEAFEERFGFPLPRIYPFDISYNFGPHRQVPVIYNEAEGGPVIGTMHWQLIPHFAKEFKSKYAMHNTRVESFEKKDFRERLLRYSRCLIPANNFFEWLKEGKQKLPYLFELTDEEMMTFGAIASTWRDPQGTEHLSCSIITLPANEIVGKVHHRMPFILSRETEKIWMDKTVQDAKDLLALIEPYPAEKMTAARVSTEVNSTRNDGPELLVKLEA